MPDDSVRDAAVFAVMKKVDDIAARWNDARAEADHAREQLKTADEQQKICASQYEDCKVTARLFGFDLDVEWKAYLARQHRADTAAEAQANSIPASGSGIDTEETKRPTIREFVLETAKQAYPNHIRAVELRRQLETKGIITHEKTIGMTLYRLSKEQLLRRSGRSWFFVAGDNPKDSGAQDEGNPGDQPGSINPAEIGGGL